MTACTRETVSVAPSYIEEAELFYGRCGKTPTVDVHNGRHGVCQMCPEHAREAERDGCDVDWPEL